MGNIQEIQSQMQDTEAAIAELSRAIALGSTPSLLSTAKSLNSRRAELQEEFRLAAAGLGKKVCSYRLFKDNSQTKISGLANTLSEFQSLFSVTFDAIKNGPKRRANISAESAQATAFDFAYAFSGSAGIVLSIEDERVLFGETDFDNTIKSIAKLLKARSSQEIAGFVAELGPATIKTMYRWAKAHTQSGLGADIEWINEVPIDHIFVQVQEFARLVEIIGETSEEEKEQISLEGILVAVDIPRKSFRMQFDVGEDIRGAFEDAIGPEHEVALPHKYRAILQKTTKITYSTDSEDVAYFLERLDLA